MRHWPLYIVVGIALYFAADWISGDPQGATWWIAAWAFIWPWMLLFKIGAFLAGYSYVMLAAFVAFCLLIVFWLWLEIHDAAKAPEDREDG